MVALDVIVLHDLAHDGTQRVRGTVGGHPSSRAARSRDRAGRASSPPLGPPARQLLQQRPPAHEPRRRRAGQARGRAEGAREGGRSSPGQRPAPSVSPEGGVTDPRRLGHVSRHHSMRDSRFEARTSASYRVRFRMRRRAYEPPAIRFSRIQHAACCSISLFASLAFCAVGFAAFAPGCGGSKADGLQGGEEGVGGDDASFGSSGGGSGGGSSGSGVFGSSGDGGTPVQTMNCPGCYVDTSCAGGGHTTISGTVFDPAGKNPLHNIVVFAPRDVTQLPKIAQGTNTCNTCDTPIGDYSAAAISDSKGHFTLSDVPTGMNVPFVAQSGKWRYVFHVTTKDCADTAVPDGIARLPKNHMEGDMPQMALLTGSADNLGCFLSGIGIANSEFTAPHGGGRLDIYQGLGNGAPGVAGGTAGACTTSSCPLWQSKASLEGYDIVLLACEGGEHPETKPQSALTAMHDWLDEGGK